MTAEELIRVLQKDPQATVYLAQADGEPPQPVRGAVRARRFEPPAPWWDRDDADGEAPIVTEPVVILE